MRHFAFDSFAKLSDFSDSTSSSQMYGSSAVPAEDAAADAAADAAVVPEVVIEVAKVLRLGLVVNALLVFGREARAKDKVNADERR